MLERGVIGIGNLSRGDDAIGRKIVQHLRPLLPPSIGAWESQGDVLELMECFQKAREIILVDALSGMGRPGEIICFRETKAFERNSSASSHGFGLKEAIELAKALGKGPQRLIIYGICGKEFAVGMAMTDEVSQAIEKVVNLLIKDLGGNDARIQFNKRAP